jgi:hypothetical protein
VIAPTADDDAVYIVMEHVEAPTLAELLDRQGPLPAPRVAALGLGILDGLDAAHAMGIVHRDVKPGNVLVADGDRVKLTDFGIALAAEDTRLTRSGVMGTHAYLAPECFDTGQAGPAADLWALGATLFHAVAGRAPFDRETTTATLRAILFEEPPTPPCEPRLAGVITGLLTRPVEQRLTGPAARERLRPIAAEPAGAAPPTPGGAGGGSGGWESQATTFHRHGPPTPAPPPSAVPPMPTPGPAGPPRPYVTPAAQGPPPARPTGPIPSASWSGRSQPQQQQPPRRSGSSSTQWALAGAVAVATVLGLVVLVVSRSGDDGSGGGPRGAAVRLLEASKDQDLAAAQATLCADDISNGFMDQLTSVQVLSYTINELEEDGDVTIVHASMQTTDEDVEDAQIPVVQEGGSWRVCFQRMRDTFDDDEPTIDSTLP